MNVSEVTRGGGGGGGGGGRARWVVIDTPRHNISCISEIMI